MLLKLFKDRHMFILPDVKRIRFEKYKQEEKELKKKPDFLIECIQQDLFCAQWKDCVF